MIAFRAPGGYAAELVVPGRALVPKPAALDWAQAAGLMLTGVTAWHALAATDVQQGDTVLIHGAAGGVGIMAVQLAAGPGATVVGTASPAHHDFLRGLGAVPVAYGAGLAERVRAPRQAESAPRWIWSAPVRPSMCRSSWSPTGRGSPPLPRSHAGRRPVSRFSAVRPGADPGTEIRDAARLELVRLAQDGALRIFVTKTFPLADAAHREIMTGHTTGKIALIPWRRGRPLAPAPALAAKPPPGPGRMIGMRSLATTQATWSPPWALAVGRP